MEVARGVVAPSMAWSSVAADVLTGRKEAMRGDVIWWRRVMSRLVASETGKVRGDNRGRKAGNPIHVTDFDPGIQRGGVYLSRSYRKSRSATLEQEGRETESEGNAHCTHLRKRIF